jgi:hypothetical protein
MYRFQFKRSTINTAKPPFNQNVSNGQINQRNSLPG